MNEHQSHPNHFFVDNKKYDTDHTALTGIQIKTIANVPANYQLFLEEQGSAPDRPIPDSESVRLDDPPPKRFYGVPSATFGKQ